MTKIATFLLLISVVVVAVWGVFGQPAANNLSDAAEGETLKLLSELSDEELAALSQNENEDEGDRSILQPLPDARAGSASSGAEVDAVPLPFVKLSPKLLCMSVGEFREEADMNRLEEDLRDKGLKVARISREIEGSGPYSVYISPMSSAEEALNLVGLLRSDGLDAIIIREGSLENGVSLGVFRSDVNSADLVARARALDYNVLRRQQAVAMTVYELFLSGPEGSLKDEDFWQKVRSEFDGIEVEEKSCEEVASVSNFQ